MSRSDLQPDPPFVSDTASLGKLGHHSIGEFQNKEDHAMEKCALNAARTESCTVSQTEKPAPEIRPDTLTEASRPNVRVVEPRNPESVPLLTSSVRKAAASDPTPSTLYREWGQKQLVRKGMRLQERDLRILAFLYEQQMASVEVIQSGFFKGVHRSEAYRRVKELEDAK